ncbi:MFS transporter [Ectothiorhodospira marina]|uniref:Predicted arabinose efflux permease, MFS family n=1 Tax=Ectothiorhodospira marina TaxID=1396821 RepID=A0A1H7QLQ6_9GAMM|nr:MFS transporter [Ectothiorhodospira marina]SEL48882.1 Predicted arabinose efflux permease, MFS family [Ectothiorhodospira marina]
MSAQPPFQQPARPVVELYETLTGDEDARVCKDIPDAACRVQPANFFVHLVSNTASKIGDELASARLVLAWLMAALGAPAALAGFLVPIRESGSLLPQLFVAAHIRRAAVRKWFWVWGSVGQAVAVMLMAVVALTLTGAAAGWAIIGLLTLFALFRGVNSVASKDVLGKTIAKQRRGTLMGYAAAAAGAVTLAVGVWLTFQASEGAGIGFFVALLMIAGGLWLLAALVFAALKEAPGATEGGGNAVSEGLRSLNLMRTDRPFRHFVITRALLMTTALALPFYVMLAQQEGSGDISGLGILIIATGLAGALSAPFWGRFSDRSSRQVLMLSGAMAGLLGILVFALVTADVDWAATPWAFAGYLFLMGIAHAGIRLGRKTYLVDMATTETRAAYTAVSNTLIGALLLVGGLFGMVAQLAGTAAAILVLSLITLAGVASAWRLEEVQ